MYNFVIFKDKIKVFIILLKKTLIYFLKYNDNKNLLNLKLFINTTIINN